MCRFAEDMSQQTHCNINIFQEIDILIKVILNSTLGEQFYRQKLQIAGWWLTTGSCRRIDRIALLSKPTCCCVLLTHKASIEPRSLFIWTAPWRGANAPSYCRPLIQRSHLCFLLFRSVLKRERKLERSLNVLETERHLGFDNWPVYRGGINYEHWFFRH